MAIGTTRSRRGLDAPSDLVIYGRVLSRAIDVHPKQITDWKDQLVELAAEVFERGSSGKASAPAVDTKALQASWTGSRAAFWPGRLSITLGVALEEALRLHGSPGIFNSDRGSKFTSDTFTDVLITNGGAGAHSGRPGVRKFVRHSTKVDKV